jgi:PAS domain S-box-containing protein
MPFSQSEYDVQDRVLDEQVELLFGQSRLGRAATLINAAIVAAVLWGTVSHAQLLAWVGAVAGVAALRFVLVRYRRRRRDIMSPRQWGRLYGLGALLAGAVWGLTGTALFPEGSVTHQLFVLMVLAGMAAGAVPLLSSVRGVYASYLVPLLLPVALGLFLHHGQVYAFVSLVVLVFMGVMLATSRRIHSILDESLHLRFANADLAQSLRAGNEFLERIMDGVSNGVFVVTAEGRIVRTNAALGGIVGRSAPEVLQISVWDLVGPEHADTLRDALARVLTDGVASPPMEIALERPAGGTATVVFNLAPLQDSEKQRAAVGTVEDVTERKALDRMKDEFISTVSHELRTPLTSIRGSLGLLSEGVGGELPGEAAGLVAIADRNCVRLLGLIDQLLDVQRLDATELPLELEPLDMGVLTREAVAAEQGYGARFNVSLELLEPVPKLMVLLDRGRYMQVLANLISNAAKFSPPGSTVDVAVAREAGRAVVSVTDRGLGIAPEFQSRLFKKFAQADASDSRSLGGAGLGLSITKALVERLGGEIGFETEPGVGTTFFVRLPLVDEGSTE